MCRNGLCDDATISDVTGSNSDTLDSSSTVDDADSIAIDKSVDAKLHQAFCASLIQNDRGSFVDPWATWWLRACRIHGSQYDSPSGAVGREFVDLLTTEIHLLVNKSAISDRLMVLCPVVLQ